MVIWTQKAHSLIQKICWCNMLPKQHVSQGKIPNKWNQILSFRFHARRSFTFLSGGLSLPQCQYMLCCIYVTYLAFIFFLLFRVVGIIWDDDVMRLLSWILLCLIKRGDWINSFFIIYLSCQSGKHVFLLLFLDFKCCTIGVMMMMMHFKASHVWVSL